MIQASGVVSPPVLKGLSPFGKTWFPRPPALRLQSFGKRNLEARAGPGVEVELDRAAVLA
jgi:hypothetical protein